MDAQLVISILFGLVCVVCVIAIQSTYLRRKEAPSALTPRTGISLLFEGNRMIDADNAIWSLLSNSKGQTLWPNVRRTLLPLMPDLPKSLPTEDETVRGSDMIVAFHPSGASCHMTLLPSADVEKHWFTAAQNRLAVSRLQPAFTHSPDPMWCVGPKKEFLWGNDAFAALAEHHGGDHAFSKHIATLLEEPEVMRSKRVKLDNTAPGQKCWLEVTTKETASGVLFFATGIDAVVRAEEAQRNFVQTLSKTFANLTTGLAIFDRDRRLALFNPALVDLSGVSVDFLSSRPVLFEFFDKLREKQIMPEPKNYDDWRERMAKLVAAASDDRFRETWNLAGGQTFDVTGRPYPDGAIAFLFNDITAEVSLTRGFRTELETMQSLLDAMEDAVAVFNQQGILIVCNAAYKQMWKFDPDTSIADSTILDATQEWKSAFHPSPVWPELRDFVTCTSERTSWDSELRSRDGREMTCRIDPICYGATLIRFCHQPGPGDAASGSDGLKIVSA